MHRALTWLALSLLTAACAPKEPTAGPAAADGAVVPEAEVEPFIGGLRVHGYTLDNGLELKVVPDDSAPVVAYQTWMEVGSADEVEGSTGLAHLFEHLMFKGTDAYADGVFSETLDGLGAEGMNAWTWVDQTVYVESVPADALEDVVRLEAQRFDGLQLDEATFESEREVVINERRLRVDDDPEGALDEKLMAAAYQAHPYGWPTIGWRRDLEALTVEDARAFYEQWYAPDAATVIVVGDVQPDAVYRLVEEHYGDMEPSGATAPERPVEPEQVEQRRVEHSMPVSADQLSAAFKTPPYVHEDTPALLVLDAILTQGQTGRLQRALRDRGYATEVGGFLAPFREPTLYSLNVTARPGVSAAQVEQALWAELERLREQGVSEGELAMGISQWQLYTWSRMAEHSGKADFLGWALTHTGDLQEGIAQIEALSEVTAEQVQAVAAEYLVPERSTVGVLHAAEPGDEVQVEAGEPVEPVERVVLDAREPAGPPAETEGVQAREAHGATILLAHDDTLPVVDFRLHFPVGAAADPAGKEGLAWLTGNMLLRGAEAHDRTTFEAALEQLGATVEVWVDADGIDIEGTVLSEHWPALATLLVEAVSEPAFDEQELAKLKDEARSDLLSLRDDDGRLAGLALRGLLYGDQHPYGRDPRGSIESVNAVTVDDLGSFHAGYLRSSGMLVGLAGDFDARARADLEGLLASIEGTPADLEPVPLVDRPEGRPVLLVDKPERTQAQVRMGQVGLDQRDDAFPAFLVANDAFGIGFSGRLMREVRVERGWSYFAYSYPAMAEHETSWQIGLAPGSERAVDAIELVLHLVEQMEAEGLTDDEFALARRARLNNEPFLVDTAGERLELAFQQRLLGYDRHSALQQVEQVTRQQASSAFDRFVEAEGLSIVIVGTASELEAPLRETFEGVEVIDYRDL